MTILFSIVCYMLCEKPGIDSRAVFKNKLQIEIEKQELTENFLVQPLKWIKLPPKWIVKKRNDENINLYI